jgi:hypothetical protein
MASNLKIGEHQEPAFRFDESELARAKSAAKPVALSLDEGSAKAAVKAQGFDPYNTSGSFDRTKHWTRVGRR